MRGDDTIGLQNKLSLLSRDGSIVQKRSRGLELGCQKLDALAFFPLCVVFTIGNASGVEELSDGLIVKLRVLADIEGGKVESENLKFVAKRANVLFDDQFTAVGGNGSGDECEICVDLLGALVDAEVAVHFLGMLDCEHHERGQLTPWFLAETVKDF